MNQRERWLETLLFGKPDRVPLSPGGRRKSTRARWHSEGLPVEIDDMNDINEYAYRISGGKEKWPRSYRTYRANASGSKGLVSSKTVYDLCGRLLRHTGRSRCDIYPCLSAGYDAMQLFTNCPRRNENIKEVPIAKKATKRFHHEDAV